eukprot:CAMPEP_0185798252 /NCGR_PEP_ID=MMETSP1174-20130828/162049_1 /TAXON_ID=35687 /ORGANISM="Dictyocha speculum, Strain CCMP1381" /LENGTH=55 /DNA_ID=CAMNT_0028493737 /DNA_START=331 /DNA_END=498 /DNA_ORIENTATION=+
MRMMSGVGVYCFQGLIFLFGVRVPLILHFRHQAHEGGPRPRRTTTTATTNTITAT